jgi:myo-inositol-1(or 4)-monophosphatase
MNDSATDGEILRRIQDGLRAASKAISPFAGGAVKVDFKSGDDPVTEADRAANRILREILVQEGEGWLSEESAEDPGRLEKARVWVVDPLDGTREFVARIPEWCISIALVENGTAIACGIHNPSTSETFLGSTGTGLTYNGTRAHSTSRCELSGATILASRTEVQRGEWKQFESAPLAIKPVGSVAYKLALVAAGLADATWTPCPKHEWDVAAGVGLITFGGGFARRLDKVPLTFNNRPCLLPHLVAGGSGLADELSCFLVPHRETNGNGRRYI